MRRGFRNRWTHDAAPDAEGLVSVTRDGTVTRFHDASELAKRKEDPRQNSRIARLKRLGYL